MQPIFLLGLEQDADKEGIVSQNEICELIGTEHVSAYARQRGLNCHVIHDLKSVDDLLVQNPSIIGFSVMTANYVGSMNASKLIKNKKKETTIVLGGPHATNYYEEALNEGCIDFIVLGEGEKTFFELATAIAESKDISETSGIVYKKNGKIIKTEKRPRLSTDELDSIDFKLIHSPEDYGKFFAKYIPHSIPASEMKFAMVVGSRGCWNDCSFCSSNSMWERKLTYRTPNNIVDEVEFLASEKGINFIFFGDDDFLINSSHAKAIAQGIIERNVKVAYQVMASVRSASKFNSYDLLKRSGCVEVTVGMETTSQNILDSIGKGYELQMLLPVANEITSHRIHLGLYYMLGFTEQAKEQLDHDYEFIKKIPFSRIRAVFVTPYPGTKLYWEVENNNLWLDGYRNNWPMMTNDQPVIKSKATPDELVQARKKVLSLYFSEAYVS